MRFVLTLSLILILAFLSYADVKELEPSQDAFVCDCVPTMTNPMLGPNFLAQGQFGVCFDRSFYEWDFTELGIGSTINNAEVHLYAGNVYGTTHGEMVYSRVTEAWGETTVNFNNQPDYTTDGQVITGWPTASTWHIVDITDIVKDWYDGTTDNYGLIGHVQGTTAMSDIAFYSTRVSSAAFRPKLVVDYTPDTTVVQTESLGIIKATLR